MQEAAIAIESIVILVILGLVLWERKGRTFKRWWKAWRAKPKWERQLQARTLEGCQDCRLADREHMPERTKARQPWREVKSRRGRPKTHDSNGQACMEPTCVYYKDTDADYHALRWDGTRNTCEKTDQWECAACGSKHTARLGTPAMALGVTGHRWSVKEFITHPVY